MRPRIGITASTRRDPERPTVQQNRAYVDAVAEAGGLPLVLPVLDPSSVDDVLSSVDGLLLSGGADVDPTCYGQQPHPEVYGVDPERDAWEIALVRVAIDRGTPVLAICRGQQVLNVAYGGTLVQHLPEITDATHRDPDGSGSTLHPVDVAADSALRRVLGTERLDANTQHHQAVDQIGTGLRVCAWAPDGTTEGIEPDPAIADAATDGSVSTSSPRVLGVQWHPELLTTQPRHRALFEWLVDAAAATSTATTSASATALS